MRGLQFDNRAFEELREWAVENPKILQRTLRIIEECQRDPFKGIGKPEPLKGDLKAIGHAESTTKTALFTKLPKILSSFAP